jgi:hypothetical protein
MRIGTLALPPGQAAASESRSSGTGSAASAFRYRAVADQLLT